MTKRWLVCVPVLACAVLAAPGQAQEALRTPVEVVDAFHAALAAGDSSGALSWLAPDVLIYESGSAEPSRAEFASHHLGLDMEFAGGTTREITGRQDNVEGDIAWVMTTSRTTGKFRTREINVRGVETMLLRRTPDGWRIAHIHWSSRRQG